MVATVKVEPAPQRFRVQRNPFISVGINGLQGGKISPRSRSKRPCSGEETHYWAVDFKSNKDSTWEL